MLSSFFCISFCINNEPLYLHTSPSSSGLGTAKQKQNKNIYRCGQIDTKQVLRIISSSKTTESVKKLMFLFVRWFDSRKGHYLRFCFYYVETLGLKNNEGNIFSLLWNYTPRSIFDPGFRLSSERYYFLKIVLISLTVDE